MASRKRLSQEESRLAALNAAQSLLIETGPQSVTLKAVAQRVGRTHANLLHHFGSASGLQKALAAYLAQSVCATIKQAIEAARAGQAQPREVVDLTFDAFGKGGGGALASWMLASGNEDALDPIIETIHKMVDDLHPEEVEQQHTGAAHRSTHTIVLLALGDSLIGHDLATSLNLPVGQARDTAEELIKGTLERLGQDNAKGAGGVDGGDADDLADGQDGSAGKKTSGK